MNQSDGIVIKQIQKTQNYPIPAQEPSYLTTISIKEQGETLANFASSILFSNIGLSLIQSTALHINWGFINTQQLITFTSLFQFGMPYSVFYFFQLTQGIYKFTLFSTYEITKLLFGMKEDTYNYYTSNFGQFGFQNHLFIFNMDLNFYLFLLYPVIVLMIVLFGLLGRFSILFNTIKERLMHYFVFGFIIRLTIQTYLLIMISCLVNFIMAGEEDYLNYFNQLSFMFSIIFIVLIPMISCGTFFYLMKNFNNLKSRKVRRNLGTFYYQISSKSRIKLAYGFLQFIRRFIFALTAVFLKDYLVIQLQLTLTISVLITIYLVQVRPYKQPALNYLDMINEYFFLLYNYMLFVFTDKYDDPVKDNVGWALIAIIEFPYVVNVIYQFYIIFRLLRNKVWNRYCRRGRNGTYGTVKTQPTSLSQFFTDVSSLDSLASFALQSQKSKGQKGKFAIEKSSLESIIRNSDLESMMSVIKKNANQSEIKSQQIFIKKQDSMNSVSETSSKSGSTDTEARTSQNKSKKNIEQVLNTIHETDQDEDYPITKGRQDPDASFMNKEEFINYSRFKDDVLNQQNTQTKQAQLISYGGGMNDVIDEDVDSSVADDASQSQGTYEKQQQEESIKELNDSNEDDAEDIENPTSSIKYPDHFNALEKKQLRNVELQRQQLRRRVYQSQEEEESEEDDKNDEKNQIAHSSGMTFTQENLNQNFYAEQKEEYSRQVSQSQLNYSNAQESEESEDIQSQLHQKQGTEEKQDWEEIDLDFNKQRHNKYPYSKTLIQQRTQTQAINQKDSWRWDSFENDKTQMFNKHQLTMKELDPAQKVIEYQSEANEEERKSQESQDEYGKHFQQEESQRFDEKDDNKMHSEELSAIKLNQKRTIDNNY